MKYKASANIFWEFETEDKEPTKAAILQLAAMLPNHVSYRISKVAVPIAKQTKTTLGVFSPEEVLPYLTNSSEKKEYKVGNKSYFVSMNSHRYFVFRTNRKCAACGLEGTKFILESHAGAKTMHFNLYGEEEGKLVLMTKDHIRPKSLAGENVQSNYQNLCAICNNLKGNSPITLEGIAELRRVFNVNKRLMPKRQLNILLEDIRQKYVSPVSEDGQPLKSGIYTKVDFELWDRDGMLVAECVYGTTPTGTLVASVKKGTLIASASIWPENSKYVIVPFIDGAGERIFAASKSLLVLVP
jgi:hypothetical protein